MSRAHYGIEYKFYTQMHTEAEKTSTTNIKNNISWLISINARKEKNVM